MIIDVTQEIGQLFDYVELDTIDDHLNDEITNDITVVIVIVQQNQ